MVAGSVKVVDYTLTRQTCYDFMDRIGIPAVCKPLVAVAGYIAKIIKLSFFIMLCYQMEVSTSFSLIQDNLYQVS